MFVVQYFQSVAMFTASSFSTFGNVLRQFIFGLLLLLVVLVLLVLLLLLLLLPPPVSLCSSATRFTTKPLPPSCMIGVVGIAFVLSVSRLFLFFGCRWW